MRIVVKIGTSTLAHPGGRLNIRNVEELVKVLADLKNTGHEIILVSSGAIGMGIGKLNMDRAHMDIMDRAHMDIPAKQAAAAVGQCELMHTYDTLFLKYSHTVGQILITSEDIEDPERRANFENTMKTLLAFGALPIVNENDTVATTEINSVGDNDTLGAIVAKTIGADILILMSDIDGLFTSDPNKDPDARLIETVEEITKEIEAFAGDACSDLGTGGIKASGPVYIFAYCSGRS